jgi:hypothetical protein
MTRSVRLLWLVALVVAVYALVPVAVYADPLDPTWLGGFWEDDDFDYLVLLVTDGKASLPPAMPALSPTLHAIGAVPAAIAETPTFARRAPFYRRGPPLA